MGSEGREAENLKFRSGSRGLGAQMKKSHGVIQSGRVSEFFGRGMAIP
jgi:hypothetical protein